MKWILLISGFAILFSVCILYVVKLKKLLKEDLDDYQNANYLFQKDEEKTEKNI